MQHHEHAVRRHTANASDPELLTQWRAGHFLAILLEHPDGLVSPELIVELDDLAPNTLTDALDALTEEDVIVTDEEERIGASRCAWHLDALSLICA